MASGPKNMVNKSRAGVGGIGNRETSMTTKILTVLYNKKVMKCFKAKAQAQDDELLGYLLGGYRDREFIITDIEYPAQFATPNWVAEKGPRKRPKNCIGTIHSHPNEQFNFVSKEDIRTATEEGDRVFGVYTWGLRPTSTDLKISRKLIHSMDFYSVDKYVKYVKGY